jgi:hypothetical protein
MGTGKFELSFGIGIIIYVEVALKWNHISGVHSLSAPGQFMPFFIALAQLITTFYRLGKYTLIKSVEEDVGGQEGKCSLICNFVPLLELLTELWCLQETKMSACTKTNMWRVVLLLRLAMFNPRAAMERLLQTYE